MGLSLKDVRRIASDIARVQRPPLEVVAAMPAGERTYAEVILTIRGCRTEPCRVIVGVSRNTTEAECRAAVKAALEEHFTVHRPIGVR
jgi:hypothetical protein